MTDFKPGDRVRYDAPPEYYTQGGAPWFEGTVIGPATNRYRGWFSVHISASHSGYGVGECQDFGGYALERLIL